MTKTLQDTISFRSASTGRQKKKKKARHGKTQQWLRLHCCLELPSLCFPVYKLLSALVSVPCLFFASALWDFVPFVEHSCIQWLSFLWTRTGGRRQLLGMPIRMFPELGWKFLILTGLDLELLPLLPLACLSPCTWECLQGISSSMTSTTWHEFLRKYGAL